jgi:pimeloyl-ACP methyl ester carboxylesterase
VPNRANAPDSNVPASSAGARSVAVSYRNATVDGLNIFYREAGPADAPIVVLLHGFPSSSHMYRDLIPLLAAQYHVVAPDYPGFGFSDAPSVEEFPYSFDRLAEIVDRFLDQLGIQKYSIYIQDYGSPVGFRLATAHPERIQAIISQNGNAYDEGLSSFWAENLTPFWENRNDASKAKIGPLLTLDVTRYQYLQGARNPEKISPDSYRLDQFLLDRPGNAAIQLELFYDYRKNLTLYPAWHRYLRTAQPPLLAVWGKNDPIFLPAGAEAFLRDDPNAEVHFLETGHFALEEESDRIADYVLEFLNRNVR